MSGDFLLDEDEMNTVSANTLDFLDVPAEEPVTICADCKRHKIDREWWATKVHYCTAERTIDYVTGEPEINVVLCVLRNRGNCNRFEAKETK